VARTATLLALAALAACARESPRELSAPELAAERAAVSAFVREVAADVSREGPAAWSRHFAGGKEFFMAADGVLVFADGDAAARGVEALTKTITAIELKFGEDLRVDPLTRDLAVVAVPYHEVLTDADGQRTESRGYFTALAERRAGRWRLRDAHWSVPGP